MKLHVRMWLCFAITILPASGCGDSSHRDGIVVEPSATTNPSQSTKSKRPRPPSPPEGDDGKVQPSE